MNAVHAAMTATVLKKAESRIEFGNLRKSSTWGQGSENQLKWIYEIDLLSMKPMQYVIVYDLVEERFSCYSKMGGKNEMNSLLTLSTSSLEDLKERLIELARNIPSLRERMLREYLYTHKEPGAKRRFLKIFKKSRSRSEYLGKVIDTLFSQQKISEGEAERARIYAAALD